MKKRHVDNTIQITQNLHEDLYNSNETGSAAPVQAFISFIHGNVPSGCTEGWGNALASRQFAPAENCTALRECPLGL